MLLKSSKNDAKMHLLNNSKYNCKQKTLHGHYVLKANDADVDKCKINHRLKSTGLKVEAEVCIMAAQNQSLFKKNYKVNIKMV